MSWLRIRGSAALLGLAGWAGLAAAQTPKMPLVPPNGPPPVIIEVQSPDGPAKPMPVVTSKPAVTSTPTPATTNAAPRIVTVTENGKTIRCRILESWQLANGTTAHKLQAIESGEYITIMDDPSPAKSAGKGAAKQIYHWGLKNPTPPAGVPTSSSNSGIMKAQQSNAARVAASASPYMVGQTSTVIPGSGSPYSCATCQVGSAACSASSSPYGCGSQTPNTLMTTGGITTPCAPGCTIVSQPPTIRDKIQNLFGGGTMVAEPGPIVVGAEKKARPRESALAIADVPSSAQPARTEIVCPPTKEEVVRGWSKDACSGTPSRFATSAEIRRDVVCTPERWSKGTVTVQESAVQGTPTGLPPGSASVLAARCGMEGPLAYVPVQTPVVPQPWRAPVPPDPRVPEAPQLNAFVNAFTPPKGAGAPQVYNPVPMMGNNGMMPYGMMPYGMAPNGMMPYGMAPYGMMPYGMMPYGMNPYAGMNPYMPQMMPYGYPVMQTGYPMMQPMLPANSPRLYQGPLPPNPFGTPAQPMMMQQVGYQQPAAPAVAPSAGVQIAQWIDMLHDSESPAQREMAATYLANCDWRNNPQVAAALIHAARQDPAPTVRAGCVLCLARMNCQNEAVTKALQALRTDADPRVREAVDQANARFGH